VPTSDTIPVALTADQWRLVQMALDTQFYEDEHRKPIGISRERRQERRGQARSRLEGLVEIDRTIANSTGLEPLLS
jgi:hypothetical protein